MRHVVAALLLLLLGATAWKVHAVRAQLASAGADAGAVARMKARLGTIPLVLKGGAFRGRSEPEPDWIVERSGADAAASIVYLDAAGRDYRLYVGGAVRASGYFHKPDGCLPSIGWELVENASVPFTAFPTAQASPMMRRFVGRFGPQQMLVYFWFQAGRDVSANDLASSYFRFRNLLTSELMTPSYVVSVYVKAPDALDAAEERAAAFLAAVGPALEAALASGE